MARKIRWQVKFKTLKENDARIDIYEEGWTGGIAELEPAENPFTTEEDSDDDYLKPVRTHTGYLRVIDNGDLEGLMPEDNSQHYIELYIKNNLEWCGYMQADTFSEDWDITPLVMEYPVISSLGILDGIYLDQNKGMGVVMLAELLLECIEATGVDFDRIYFPREVWFSEDESAQTPFSVSLSRQTFFTDNGSDEREAEDWERYDADTCLSFLEEFCKFWGWTLYERQKTLYFLGNSELHYITTVEDLRKIVYNGNPSFSITSIARSNLSSLPLDGNDNKKEILQGVRKIKISEKIKGIKDVIQNINSDEIKPESNFRTSYDDFAGKVAFYEQVIMYNRKDYYGRLETKIYDKNWVDISDNIAGSTRMWSHGANYIKYDRFNSLSGKRNYDYREAIRIMIKTNNQRNDLPSEDISKNHPLVMISGKTAVYNSGAFVISGNTNGIEASYYTSVNDIVNTKETNGRCILPAVFKVGDKYWNGTDWVGVWSVFEIRIGDQDDENKTDGAGKIVSTKTLAMPYNGADGYVIPIKRILSGLAVFWILPPYKSTTTYFLYINNFKIDYYMDDSKLEIGSQSKEDNYYNILTGKNFNSEKEIVLNIATGTEVNGDAYNILYNNEGNKIDNLYFLSNSRMERPEQHLLGILKQVYGRVIEKLNITVEQSYLNPMMRLVRNGKEYRILSEKIEWADDSEEIMIENIPD